MAVQVSYPGVYIEEFTPGAPIEGVGTNIAAFLGPASDGPLNEPVKITNWDQFLQNFGERPLTGFYLWYAVRGFFTNGGMVCYVTRVSNATFPELTIDDATTPVAQAKPAILIRARKPGAQPQIKIAVEHVAAVLGTGANACKLFRPTATIVDARDSSITVSDAAEAAQGLHPGAQRFEIEQHADRRSGRSGSPGMGRARVGQPGLGEGHVGLVVRLLHGIVLDVGVPPLRVHRRVAVDPELHHEAGYVAEERDVVQVADVLVPEALLEGLRGLLGRLEQPRVVDGDGRLRRQADDQAFVSLLEHAARGMSEEETAQDLAGARDDGDPELDATQSRRPNLGRCS